MISLSCPSRGRPQLAKRMIDTAYDTAAGDIEFLIYLNNDDPALEEYKDKIDENKSHRLDISSYRVEKPWGYELWLELNEHYAYKSVSYTHLTLPTNREV